MKFLQNLLAVIVGLFIFSGMAVAGFFLFITVLASQEETVAVKENSVLHIKLNNTLTETEQPDVFSQLFQGDEGVPGLAELKEALNAAKDDEKIKGVFIEHGIFSAGFAHIQELRAVLTDFKQSGKFVVSYGNYMTEGAYFLTSTADEIYITPEGLIEFNGISANITFFKGLLDKLNIEMQIFRPSSNTFKSAVEPFIRTNMSDSSKMQLTGLLTDIEVTYLNQVAVSRGLTLAEVSSISNEMKARNIQDAVDLKLIDGAKYYDEVIDILRDKLDLEADEDIDFISPKKYRKSIEGEYSKNRIAVIVASGNIVEGQGDKDNVGGDKFAKLIREAADDDKIKAIVMRINSPGGSALASDLMWRELKEAANKKPVIASMSNLAASGGYYMAVACDTIVADPNTITGSIGIFMMLPNMSGFFEDKIGLSYDVVSTGQYSDLYTVTRPLTQDEKNILGARVDDGYASFTSKVAEGRNMPIDQILKLAGGRVWTGNQALENGLVDVLGGLDYAIELAAEKANITDDYSTRYYPEKKEFVQELLESMGQEVQMRIVKAQAGALYPYLDDINQIKSMQGMQTRLPFELEIY